MADIKSRKCEGGDTYGDQGELVIAGYNRNELCARYDFRC
jgi:hypothetical protein